MNKISHYSSLWCNRRTRREYLKQMQQDPSVVLWHAVSLHGKGVPWADEALHQFAKFLWLFRQSWDRYRKRTDPYYGKPMIEGVFVSCEAVFTPSPAGEDHVHG